MRSLLLGALLALACAGGARAEDDPLDIWDGDYEDLDWGMGDDDFMPAFGVHSDVSCPYSVAVGLVGLSDELLGEDSVRADELDRVLRHQLPQHTPACLDPAAPGPGRVVFDLSYEVFHLPTQLLEAYEAALKGAMGQPVDDAELLVFDVDIAAVESVLLQMSVALRASERAQSSDLLGREPASPAVLVLSPRLSHVRPAAARDRPFVYRFIDAKSADEGAYVQTWVGRGDFVVADITSGPVEYGGLDEDEGTVSGVSFPRIVLPHLMREMDGGSEEDEAKKEEEEEERLDGDDDWMYDLDVVALPDSSVDVFHAKLATLILSAVQRVMLPDFAIHTLPAVERVLVPIIALRDHAEYDPLASLDLAQVREQVQRLLLPSQEVVVVAATHSLHEHPRIALAMEEALRSDTVYRREGGKFVPRHVPFVDAGVLHAELARAGDLLAAELLHEGAAGVAPLLMLDDDLGGAARAQDSRVVPVYLFSSAESAVTFHGGSLVDVGADSVLVLQSATTALFTPFASDGEPIHANAMRATTRRIIAGLAESVAGLRGPSERLEGGIDYIWSHGFQPFGPFATSSELSELVVAAGRRNMLVSRVSAALHHAGDALAALDEFAEHHVVSAFRESVSHNAKADADVRRAALLQEGSSTALETHERLLRDLEQVEVLMGAAADELAFGFDAARAEETSAVALAAALALRKHVDQALHTAERALACCVVTHEPQTAEVRVVSLTLVAVIAVLVFLMALLCVLPMRERTRQKQ